MNDTNIEPGEGPVGLVVLDERPATDAEVRVLYKEAKEASGLTIPELEKYLPLAEEMGRVALFTGDPQELAIAEAASS
jgi:hypothetical protein